MFPFRHTAGRGGVVRVLAPAAVLSPGSTSTCAVVEAVVVAVAPAMVPMVDPMSPLAVGPVSARRYARSAGLQALGGARRRASAPPPCPATSSSPAPISPRRGVTIDSLPDEVWRWLVQIGHGRRASTATTWWRTPWASDPQRGHGRRGAPGPRGGRRGATRARRLSRFRRRGPRPGCAWSYGVGRTTAPDRRAVTMSSSRPGPGRSRRAGGADPTDLPSADPISGARSVMWHIVEPIGFVMERHMLRGRLRRARRARDLHGRYGGGIDLVGLCGWQVHHARRAEVQRPAAVRQKTHRSGSVEVVKSASRHAQGRIGADPDRGISCTGGGAHAVSVTNAATAAPRTNPFIVASLLLLPRGCARDGSAGELERFGWHRTFVPGHRALEARQLV